MENAPSVQTSTSKQRPVLHLAVSPHVSDDVPSARVNPTTRMVPKKPKVPKAYSVVSDMSDRHEASTLTEIASIVSVNVDVCCMVTENTSAEDRLAAPLERVTAPVFD